MRQLSIHSIMTAVIAISLLCCQSLQVVSSTTSSTPPTRSQTARDRVWNGMVRNFGYRWEGRTYWYDPEAESSDNNNNNNCGGRIENDLRNSIYQLEFPEDGRTGVGTWKGWNVLKDGDTRIVPLSRETCIDRTKGSSTFQFVPKGGVGVGGRCPSAFPTFVDKNYIDNNEDEGVSSKPPTSDNENDDERNVLPPQQMFIEINFFHGIIRRGVVVTYELEKEKRCYRRNSRIMVMNFRRASNGYRDDGKIEPDNLMAISSTIQKEAASATDDTATFFSSLTPKHSFDLSRNDYLERETTTEKNIFDIVKREEEGYVYKLYPEGLFLCLPDSIPLCSKDDAEEDTTFELQFGCDFRGDGGPVKLLCAKYGRGKQLTGWSLHELV